MTKKQRKKYVAWVANRREKRRIPSFDRVDGRTEPQGFFSPVLNLFRRFK